MCTVYRKINFEEIEWLIKYANPRLRSAYFVCVIGGYNEVPYTDWCSAHCRNYEKNRAVLKKHGVVRLTQMTNFGRAGFNPIQSINTQQEFETIMGEVVKMVKRGAREPNPPKLSTLFEFSLFQKICS